MPYVVSQYPILEIRRIASELCLLVKEDVICSFLVFPSVFDFLCFFLSMFIECLENDYN